METQLVPLFISIQVGNLKVDNQKIKRQTWVVLVKMN